MLTPRRKGSDYHHGDLKSAAILTARQLIEVGGVQALGIRRVAEEIGVTAPALYRHFLSLEDLLGEVSRTVRVELGDAMLHRRSSVKTHRDKKKFELEKFRAIGEAYIDFAERHPRLFEIAFIHNSDETIGDYDDLAWEILNESVENFVALGMTSKKKRDSAPLVAWSAVHGLATLVANKAIAEGDVEFFRKAVMDGVQDSLLN